MRKVLTLFTILAMVLTIAGRASAVDFAKELQKLAAENGKGYVGPFATAFGTAMNSGLYHTAKPHGLGGFDISFKMALVTVPDDALNFEFDMARVPFPYAGGQIDLDGNILYSDRNTATVFGESEIDTFTTTAASTEAAFRQALSDQAFADFSSTHNWETVSSSIPDLPGLGGIDISTLPLIIPQISVGLIMDTEVMLRFFPEINIDKIGDVKFLGFGIKHGIDQWIPIPMFPVNITAQFVWQKLEIGELLTSKHTAFNIQASKKLGIGISITPYVGLGTESSTLDVSYTVANPNSDPTMPPDGTVIEFNLDGDNGFRMTAGARLALALITLNVDYSLGEYSSISAGFGITFR